MNKKYFSHTIKDFFCRHKIFFRSIALLSGLALILSVATGCGEDVGANQSPLPLKGALLPHAPSLNGAFHGGGASSQKSAVDVWNAGFMRLQPNTQLSYDPFGSGAGISSFLARAILWAGTDAPLSALQAQEAEQTVCNGGVIQVPAYSSPIAIAYNLSDAGLNSQHVRLTPAIIAQIFRGEITKWNNPLIQKYNPSIADKLPDIPIIPIWRSDKSGTTENFSRYLRNTAPHYWPYTPQETWPTTVGEGAQGTSGVMQTLHEAQGTITYADASQTQDVGNAAIQVTPSNKKDEPFYSLPKGEGVTRVLEKSQVVVNGKVVQNADMPKTQVDIPQEGDFTPLPQSHIEVVRFNYHPDHQGDYPLALVSYDVACRVYQDPQKASFVKQWLSYVESTAAQENSELLTGSAPLPENIRQQALRAVQTIEAQPALSDEEIKKITSTSNKSSQSSQSSQSSSQSALTPVTNNSLKVKSFDIKKYVRDVHKVRRGG